MFCSNKYLNYQKRFQVKTLTKIALLTSFTTKVATTSFSQVIQPYS